MKYFFITLSCIALLGCNNNYKKTSVDYLKSKIINPESLDIISFKGPDSSKSTFFDTDEYKNLKFKVDSLMQLSNQYSEKAIEYVGVSKKGVDLYKYLSEQSFKESSRILDVIKNRSINYKGFLKQWWVGIVFKAKNADGEVKIDTCALWLSKDFNKVNSDMGINL